MKNEVIFGTLILYSSGKKAVREKNVYSASSAIILSYIAEIMAPFAQNSAFLPCSSLLLGI